MIILLLLLVNLIYVEAYRLVKENVSIDIYVNMTYTYALQSKKKSCVEFVKFVKFLHCEDIQGLKFALNIK